MPVLNDLAAASHPGPTGGEKSILIWDDETAGFGLRIFATGARSWVVRFRVGKQQRMVSLGPITNTKCPQARRKARDMLAGARLGDDPLAAIQAKKAKAAKLEFTLEKLIEAYLAGNVDGRLRDSSVRSIRYSMEQLAKPLHGKDPATLHRREIAELVQKISKANGVHTADLFARHMARLFSWSMRSGLAEHNPADKLPRQRNGDIGRDRVLKDAELAAVWNALDDASDYAAIVRLLILTGQRREEVGAMPWSELDLDAAEWTIAADRAKNGRAHLVPLSAPAVAILKARKRKPGAHFVFGRLESAFSGFSKGKNALDAALAKKEAGVAPWRLHDLRRSAVTGMAELGVQPHIIEAVVNHASGHKAGVAGVYNRAAYAAEKRQALDLWAAHVLAIAAGEKSKVVAIRRPG